MYEDVGLGTCKECGDWRLLFRKLGEHEKRCSICTLRSSRVTKKKTMDAFEERPWTVTLGAQERSARDKAMAKLVADGHAPKDVAKKYDVNVSTVYRAVSAFKAEIRHWSER